MLTTDLPAFKGKLVTHMLFLANHPYIINIVLILVLLACLLKSQSMLSQLLILFWYTTLHYAYAWLPAFITTHQHQAIFFKALVETPNNSIKLLGFVFLFLFYSVFLYKNRNLIDKNLLRNYLFLKTVLSVSFIGIVWCLYTIYHLYIYSNQSTQEFFQPAARAKYIAYYLLLILITLLFGLFFKKYNLSLQGRNRISLHIAISSTIAASLNIVLFLCGNQHIYPRIYAYLLNPNMFAFYCCFFTMIICYFAIKDKPNKYHIVSLISFSICLFYSGSRSMLIAFTLTNIIWLFLLLLCRLFIKTRYFLICMFILYLIPVCLLITPLFVNATLNRPYTLTSTTRHNAMRFLSGRQTIMYIINKHINNHTNNRTNNRTFDNINNQKSVEMSRNMASIQGRFSPTIGTDNNYIVMKLFTGWIGLSLWILQLSLILIFSFYKLYKTRTLEFALNTSLLIYCLISASMMNIFFLFPSIIYVAAVFALQLS